MTTIKVDPGFITNLADRLRRAANDLRRYSNHGSNRLDSAPKVADAYVELGRRWDHRRNQLADNLNGLADALIATRDEMVEVDKELGDSLDTGRDGSTSPTVQTPAPGGSETTPSQGPQSASQSSSDGARVVRAGASSDDTTGLDEPTGDEVSPDENDSDTRQKLAT